MLGAITVALALTTALGMWNGMLVAVVGIQPIVATLILMVAGRGIAQLITGGQIVTINSSPYNLIGNGYWLALPFALYIVAAMYGLTAALSRKIGAGAPDRVRRRQRRGEPARRRPLAEPDHPRLRLLRVSARGSPA